MNRSSSLGIAAAALLVAGAGGAALAHPHPDGDGKAKRVVIIEDGKSDGHHADGDRVRHIEIIRDGEDHAGGDLQRFEMHGGALADCVGGNKIVDESSDEGDKKTKVFVCTKGEPTAESSERLEKTLARIQ